MPLSDDPSHAQLIQRILARYSEPHRRYHGVEHVHGVVRRVINIAAAISPSFDTTEAEWAAWYHDAIYEPRANDNEERSADLAVAELTEHGLEHEQVERIAAMVRMTKRHAPTSFAESVLADADLWTLGGSPEQYAAYGALVRAEYSHVSDADWARGRPPVMEAFLNRPFVFSTEHVRTQREEAARRNISNEMALLRASLENGRSS